KKDSAPQALSTFFLRLDVAFVIISCHVSRATMNEFELIELLTKEATSTSRDLSLGVGDDCAIIRCGERDLLITTDTLIEGIHFKLSFFDPHTLGQRMLNANISDIAAMGGTPRFFTVCVGLPSGFGIRRCRELYDGLYTAAKLFDMELIGGDTSASNQLMVTIAVVGECKPDTAIRRSGARPDDPLFLTGRVGEAALGLASLEQNLATPQTASFIERYRLPQPRVAVGQALLQCGLVTSMIDISDGLLADVGHLASLSNTGYEILAAVIPRHKDFELVASRLGFDPWQALLAGGDDYELAFTVDHHRLDAFEEFLARRASEPGLSITRIGTMVGNKECQRALRGDGSVVFVSSQGYDHLGDWRE
ncbi:thiamine-phosphate kinase, partial [bacterium]